LSSQSAGSKGRNEEGISRSPILNITFISQRSKRRKQNDEQNSDNKENEIIDIIGNGSKRQS